MLSDAERTATRVQRTGSSRPGADPAAARLRQEERLAEAQTRLKERTERKAAETARREQTRLQRTSEASRLREERTVAAEKRRNQHYWQTAQKRSEDMRLRAMEVETAKAAAIGRARFGTAGTVGRNVMGTVGTVARAGAGMAAIGGGIALASGVMERLENIKIAANLAAQAGTPGAAPRLLKEAAGVRGFQTAEVLGGLERWTTLTGDLGAVSGKNAGKMQEWADLSDATSAAFGDIAQAAGTLMVSFSASIPDAQKRMEAVTETMRAMADQGTKGSVELKELATMIGEVWAGASAFGGSPVTKMRQMGAIAQVIKPTAGSTAEAVTAIQRLPDDIMQNQAKIEAKGVKIWAPGKRGTEMREAPTLIADILEVTAGHLDTLKKLGFDVRSFKVMRPLAQVFSEAETRQKGTGRTAVLSAIGAFEGLTKTPTEIGVIAGGRRQQEDKRFMERMRELNRVVGEAALPQLDMLGAEFVKLVPRVAQTTGELLKLINWAVANPWAGIGVLVGGALVKEIAGAAIGSAVRQSVTAILTPAAVNAAGSLAAVGTSGWAAHAALGKLGLIGGAIASVMVAADQFKKLWAETHGGKTPEQEDLEARKRYVEEAKNPAERAARIAQMVERENARGQGPMADLMAATGPGAAMGGAFNPLLPKHKARADVFEAVKPTYEIPGTGTGRRMSEAELDLMGGGVGKRAQQPVAIDATAASKALETSAERAGHIIAATVKTELAGGLNRSNTPSAIKG